MKRDRYDEALWYEIMVKKEYACADQEIQKANVILDVGAYKGYFAEYCIQHNKDVVMHCFEPLFQQENKLQNILWHQQAFAPRSGIIELYQHPEKGMQSSFFCETKLLPQGTKKTVEAISLADAIIKYKIGNIDLLKLDVEGMEYQICQNRSAEIRSRISAIIIECHQLIPDHQQDYQELIVLLKKHYQEVQEIPSPYGQIVSLLYAK